MSTSADTLHCFLTTKQPVASPLLIHGVYQVMEASLDLITSQCLWQDKVEEAPSG